MIYPIRDIDNKGGILRMTFECPNCSSNIMSQKKTPKIVSVLQNFYGTTDWENDSRDIAQELCTNCGTLPELISYLELQLIGGNSENFKNILNEFIENLHIPFLLQIGAPIFIYILETTEDKSLQQKVIDVLGDFGDLEDVGRYVLANPDPDIRVMGLRALEKIAKHYKKRNMPFDWEEYLNYLIAGENEVYKKIRDVLNVKNFLKETTISKIKEIINNEDDEI